MKGLNDTAKEFGYPNILNYSLYQHLILINVRIRQAPTKETCAAIYGNAIIKPTNTHIYMNWVNEGKKYETPDFLMWRS